MRPTKAGFRAHSLKSLERNVLGFCGIGPIRESLVGSVEAMGDARRRAWIERLRARGARALTGRIRMPTPARPRQREAARTAPR